MTVSARLGSDRWGRAFWQRFDDPHAVLQRQIAIVSVVSVSMLMFLRADINAGSDWLVVLSLAMVAAATVVALRLPVQGRSRSLLILIPVLDLFAVGILRYTTGGGSSLFGALLILPVISLGIERGLLPVVLAAVSCSVIIGLPILVTLGRDDWLRVVTTPLVLTLAAFTVNRLTFELRTRAGAESTLRHEQEDLLHAAEQHAAATIEVAALLRQSAQLMSSVVDAVTEQFIIATDAVGRIEVFNRGAERLLQIAGADAVGEGLLELFGLRFVRYQRPAAQQVQWADLGFGDLVADSLQARSSPGAWTYRRPDGVKVIVELSITVRRDAAGRVDGFLFVGTDVTENYEQAKLKDEFVSLISHEIRTPLSSILGYLELLGDDEDAPLSAEQRQYLEVVDRNAHRLLRLVGDLLFTAHVEAGRLSLENATVDLAAITRAAVQSARPAAAAAGVGLTVEHPDLPVEVTGDPVRLGQVCDNLLSNAVKFSRRGGAVTVRVAGGDTEGGEIAVSDTGMGIPAAEMDKLFGRFFRSSTATANAVPGVGLGLSISKAIVQAHRGTIDVRSVPGEGTTFTVSLPGAALPVA